MVKYFKGRKPSADDLGGGVTIESDCEADLQGAENESPKEEKTRAVLTMGSFSAYVDFYSTMPMVSREVCNGLPSWMSLFFYHCTDTILFAPLKSQGTDSRLDYIRQKTIAAAPPPCSSKSIYILANLVS